MSSAQWWMVCYDVHDEKRLRKCAKLMEGYGQRIQHSVFRCWLNTTAVERLRWELTELLDEEDDVLLIPLCARCLESILGIYNRKRPDDWKDEPPRHTIV